MDFITRKGFKLLDETPAEAGGQALNDNFTTAGLAASSPHVAILPGSL